jgi:hypothetical protein
MELAKLLKLLPMLITVGTLSYAAYTINGLTDAASTQATAPKDSASKDATTLLAEPEIAAEMGPGRVRDPFTAILKVEDASRPSKSKAAADPIPEILRSLDLKATFIQGKSRYASINGRLYRPGQRLEVPGAAASLVLTGVAFHHVELAANGKTYTLGYPDGLTPQAKTPSRQAATRSAEEAALLAQDPNYALMRTLLRSPLGGAARSMLAPRAGPAATQPASAESREAP